MTEHSFHVLYPLTVSLERNRKMIDFKIGRATGEPIETIWFSCLTILCGSKANDAKTGRPRINYVTC